MSQTVEFEYAIGQTVEIVPLRYTDGGVSKVLGAVDSTINKATGHIYLVEYRHRDGATCRQTFRADQLAGAPPNELLGSAWTAAAPTPTFPRVIWQGPHQGHEFRIVQLVGGTCFAEVQNGETDCMLVENWVDLPCGRGWPKEALAAIAECSTKPNGSDQDT